MNNGRLAGSRRLLSEWVLPPGLKRVLRRTRLHLERIPIAERSILAANGRLQGAYRGKRCFVLANGSSLAELDIEPLGDEVTVVMNHFNQHPALLRWQPTVHCAAEPGTFYDSPAKEEFLARMLRGYTSTVHVFPIATRGLFQRTKLLPPERLVLVRQDGRLASEFDSIDLTGTIPGAPDTSVLAVSIAIAMGCDPIVLLGLDYNWLSHRSINRHFYDDDAMDWPVEDMGKSQYLEAIRMAIPCWESHAALRAIAASHGQRILNATKGSFLDVYPRTTYEEEMSQGHT